MQQKNDFKKTFFKLMNNATFGKIKRNMIEHRDTKLVATEKRRNYLVSESHASFFPENLLAMEMRKIQILRFINAKIK